MDRALVDVIQYSVEEVPVCNGVDGWRCRVGENWEERSGERKSMPWKDHYRSGEGVVVVIVVFVGGKAAGRWAEVIESM